MMRVNDIIDLYKPLISIMSHMLWCVGTSEAYGYFFFPSVIQLLSRYCNKWKQLELVLEFHHQFTSKCVLSLCVSSFWYWNYQLIGSPFLDSTSAVKYWINLILNWNWSAFSPTWNLWWKFYYSVKKKRLDASKSSINEDRHHRLQFF